MLILENHITNATSLSLNNYLYHGIRLFKSNTHELAKYIRNRCNDNPLMYIDEEKIPLEVLAHHHSNQDASVMDELIMHFNCSLGNPDKSIMQTLIRSLNPSGFLEAFPVEVSKFLNVPVESVDMNIERLKRYERLGIGCRDVKEYIEFQLKTRGRYDERLFSLFFDHLDDIHRQQYDFLDGSNVEKDAFLDYMAVIKDCSLSPLTADANIFVEPDAVIEATSNNTLKIKIPDSLVNDIVFEPVHLRTDDPDFNDRMARYRREYEELVSIVNARTFYLKQVLSIIIHVQKAYLLKESEYLNPLDQKGLAEQTGLSPATISRLVADKYILTPKGTLPLKALLSKKVTGNTSASFVRFIISRIEDFRTVSDRKIAEHLTQYDIHISRRTVNKYKNEVLSQLKEA